MLAKVRPRFTGPGSARWVVAAGVVVALVAAAVPYLPAGPDLYVHLLWPWQVMRCLAAGDLPLWLPDLNGGFGSPGIRLYSPAGPVLHGVLGLLLGSADAALRAGPVLAALVLLLLARRARGDGRGTSEWALVVLAPLAVHSLIGRGAWSELLAIPLLWWLVDDTVSGDLRVGRHGVVLAGLWLMHAPTTVMAIVLLAGACAFRRDARRLLRLATAGAVAAALTAWHWLPLADEMRLVDRRSLTGGIFDATRNALTSSSAFALDENIWLGWCAVSLLAAIVLGRWWRTDGIRTALALGCIALAVPLAAPLYHPPSPLAMLQFPWRWLLPAAVLVAAPAARGVVELRGRLAVAVLLAPLLLFPWPVVVRGPDLDARTEWRDAGERVWRSFGGNPLLVDAVQNRPPSFALLADTMERFGPRRVVVEPPEATWQVTRWTPLEHEVRAATERGARVAVRVLDYPRWEVTVDGKPAPSPLLGAVGVALPPGGHEVRVRWRGNPWARVGQASAAVALLMLVMASLPVRGRHAA